MKRLQWAFTLAILSMAAGCSQSGERNGESPGKLVITGSSTVAPVVGEIARRFESLHPGVRIDVQTGGSSRGMADCRQGLSDIGMVSRDLKENEGDLIPYALARDGITLITHRDNPTGDLTDAQVKAAFSGAVTNWSELGGPDLPITVINKAEGRSTLELFLSHFKLASTDVKAHVIIGDNEQGIKSVAGIPGAVGYVSIGAAEYAMGREAAIRSLALNGIVPTLTGVGDGSFPLSRTLNLVVKSSPQGLLKEFLEFAQSEKVHDLLENFHLLPITD